MNFGLPPKSLKMIINALKQQKEIEKASVFGSRSMGNYKAGSDIDIAVYGHQITQETLNQLRLELNENLPIPYYFDIVHFESLKNAALKEHINTFGKSLYQKGDG